MNNFIPFKKTAPKTSTLTKKGWKFWLIFWALSVSFLFSWFVFLNYRNHGWFKTLELLSPVLKIIPIEDKQKTELRSIFKISSILSENKEVQTFLILFQNNMELRPGGGFIGAFGILKIKNGEVIEMDVHDTNIFDDRIDTKIEPPYPMAETLSIKSWEMRDSNWSPDFNENAQKAVELYKLQGGDESFNGVIAISTELLASFLGIVGPVEIEGFPGEYNSDNAIAKLEYQVEKGYKKQDIEKGKRKYIMKYLAKEILVKSQKLRISERKKLLLKLEEHLDKKDVMLTFFDSRIQDEIIALNWDGEVERNVPQDYLMLVDANLASYKTDPYIVRSFEYEVNFTEENPIAKIDVIYKNTAKEKNWMTNDYQSYLRVYTPSESWLLNTNSTRPVKFGEEFNKKYFGTLVQIPINATRTFHFEYRLSKKITFENYSLMIQKQSGVAEIEGEIKLINKKGEMQEQKVTITQDQKIN